MNVKDAKVTVFVLAFDSIGTVLFLSVSHKAASNSLANKPLLSFYHLPRETTILNLVVAGLESNLALMTLYLVAFACLIIVAIP